MAGRAARHDLDGFPSANGAVVDRLEKPSRILEIVELVDEDEIDVCRQLLDKLSGPSLQERRLAHLPRPDQDESLRFRQFPP